MYLPFRVREFCFPEDYGPVIKLWDGIDKGVKIGRSDAPAELQKKLLRDPDLFLVADVDGDIVGSVIGGYDGRRGIVYHLAVNEAFRGQGIGSHLMDEVESRLRAKGCLKCYLMVDVNNFEVGHYYENRGWHSMDYVQLYGKDLQ